MSTVRAYTHACACALLLIVGAVAVLLGPALAVDTALAGAFVLAYLLAGEAVSRQFVLAAAGHASGIGVGRLVLQQVAALPLSAVLMALLGPRPVALALGCTLGGALLRAAVQALRAVDASAVTAVEPTC